MINVLRLGHRIKRDERVTTHLALTARAFLADKLYYTGQRDKGFENVIREVNSRFGSNFDVEHIEEINPFLKNFNGIKVHLTMYGLPFKNCLDKLKGNLLIIVGGSKVERSIYDLVDYNLSVTNQPISEISALSVFLHEYLNGEALKSEFKGHLKIIPQKRSKKVIKS